MNKTLSLDEVMRLLEQAAARRADGLDDRALQRQLLEAVTVACGSEQAAILELCRRLAASGPQLRKLAAQNKELTALLKDLEKKSLLGWVLSAPFALNGDGRRFVYAMPLARDAAPQCYELARPQGGEDHPAAELPEPPFLGLIQQEARIFFGPAAAPPAPIPADILRVSSSRAETSFGVGEIEVADGPDERKFTVPAGKELAAEVKRRLEEGENVFVRVERGVVTGIHSSEEREAEDWLEFVSPEGPGIKDLVFPKRLHRELDGCLRMVASGKPVSALLIGPTGTGKTSTAVNFGRDVCRLSAERGSPRKGCALIRVGSAHTGSSYINQTERNMRRAVKRAESLAKQGYAVVLLLDEGDSLVGELSSGLEHAHNRSERLTVQSLLGEGLQGPVAVFLTMNARRQSFLPAAVRRRFRLLEYPRPTRSQMAAVARLCASRRPGLLKALDMPAEDFGEAFAMNLFSDGRVVATAHMHSGRDLQVRARDLQLASPGKAEELIAAFAFDMEEGQARGLEDLWAMLDREFRAPDMTKHNIWDLTFLSPPRDDEVRTLEVAR